MTSNAPFFMTVNHRDKRNEIDRWTYKYTDLRQGSGQVDCCFAWDFSIGAVLFRFPPRVDPMIEFEICIRSTVDLVEVGSDRSLQWGIVFGREEFDTTSLAMDLTSLHFPLRHWRRLRPPKTSRCWGEQRVSSSGEWYVVAALRLINADMFVLSSYRSEVFLLFFSAL